MDVLEKCDYCSAANEAMIIIAFRFGEHGLNRRGEASQVIRAGDENILNAPVSQAVQHGSPELCAHVFADPHAEHIFLAVQIDSYGNVHRLLHDLALAAEMAP